MMRKKALVAFVALGIFVSLTGCTTTSSGNPPNPQIGSMSNQPSPALKSQQLFFSSLQMFSETKGWALGGGTILRTADGGQQWADVKPRGFPDGPRFAAQFLDADTGWVAAWNGSSSRVSVFRTSNGGQTWRSAGVPVKTNGAEVYPVSLSFVDAQRGWMMVEPDHGMNSSPGQLLATRDGGESWSELASTDGEKGGLPFGGLIAFRNASDGWLVGAQVSTINRSMFATHDGGRTWGEEHLALPPGLTGGTLDFTSPPKFFSSNGKDGILPVTFVPDSHKANEYATIVYFMRDGGRNWGAPRKLGGTPEFITMTDAWRWQSEPRDSGSTAPVKGELYRTRDGGQSWTPINPDQNLSQYLQEGFDVAQLDFVTDQVGWALLWSPGGRESKVLKTADGGDTWSRSY